MVDLVKLRAHFPPDRISWRIGSTTGDKSKGLALAYVDARDVQDRFDEACGPENWQNRFLTGDSKRVFCEIGIRIGDEWVWKSDGAGDTDVEGEKGAISDAFKRAAVKWGVARYLYDLDSPWVAVESAGRSFKIKESEYARLRGILARVGGATSADRGGNPASAQSASSGPASPPSPPPPPPSTTSNVYGWAGLTSAENAAFTRASLWMDHAEKALRASDQRAALWFDNVHTFDRIRLNAQSMKDGENKKTASARINDMLLTLSALGLKSEPPAGIAA